MAGFLHRGARTLKPGFPTGRFPDRGCQVRRELNRDYADLVGGALLMGGGALLAVSSLNYSLGTARRMGPGYFPFGIGCLVLLMGIICFLPAIRRAAPLPVIEWRPFIWISLSVLAFMFTVERFGLVPATTALTLFAVVADGKPRVVQTVLLAAVLSVLGVVIFSWGLGMPLPSFRWGR